MTWDEIYAGVAPMVDKVAVKIAETADLAALEFKRSAQEKALQSAYAALGKLFYVSVMSTEKTLDEQISSAVSTVAIEQKKLAAIEAQIRKAKERSSEKNESL